MEGGDVCEAVREVGEDAVCSSTGILTPFPHTHTHTCDKDTILSSLAASHIVGKFVFSSICPMA